MNLDDGAINTDAGDVLIFGHCVTPERVEAEAHRVCAQAMVNAWPLITWELETTFQQKIPEAPNMFLKGSMTIIDNKRVFRGYGDNAGVYEAQDVAGQVLRRRGWTQPLIREEVAREQAWIPPPRVCNRCQQQTACMLRGRNPWA